MTGMSSDEMALNMLISSLRNGGGSPAPTLYAVLLTNADTGKSLLLGVGTNQDESKALVNGLERASEGKHIGFRLRVEAVTVTVRPAARIEVVA
jgi:hypothetical protein